jgi:hypothetical protein
VSASQTAQRCAQHPARPAHDRCPRCLRPRCDADAGRYGDNGCAACVAAPRVARPAGRLELTVRAGLAACPVVLVGGWIATQYVYDHIFAEVLPGLLGLACGLAANLAAPHRDRWAVVATAAISVAAAVLGTALGFRLVPGGGQSVLHPFGVVGAPYLCAVGGALAWPVVFPAPRRRDQITQPGNGTTRKV